MMLNRYVTNVGTISIDTGDSVVTGTSTLFGGVDREGAAIWAYPASGVPIYIGTVAAVDPQGIYNNLSLPLVTAYEGPSQSNVAYELIDGPAIANGTTQAALFMRFYQFLQNNMGLVGYKGDINFSDAAVTALIPNNTLFPDYTTRTLYQWRYGTLQEVPLVGSPFTPRGEWSSATTYATDDLVSYQGSVFVSNQDTNLNHQPVVSPEPASDSWWTTLPLPAVGELFLVAISAPGKPSASADLGGHVFTTAVLFAPEFVDCRAYARDAPTEDAVFSICKLVDDLPVEVGTITIAAGEHFGTFDTASGITFTSGDVLEVYAPETPDATLANVYISLLGSRDGGQELDALPISGGQMDGRVDFAAESTLAAASTTAIGAQNGNLIDITGDTQIDQFDTVGAGITRFLRFSGHPLVKSTHVQGLPGGADLQTAAGDSMVVESLGSGEWFCLSFKTASGAAPKAITRADISDATTAGRALMAATAVSDSGLAVLAGGRGGDLFRASDANASGSNSASAQPWFPTNGAVAVAAGTLYLFEGVLGLSRAAGTTSHTTAILFGGTATITSIDFFGEGRTGDTNALAGMSGFWATSSSGLILKAASTSSTEQALFFVKGIIRVNSAGTLIPQFQYSAAPGGAPTILRNTWFRLIPFSSDNVGTWS